MVLEYDPSLRIVGVLLLKSICANKQHPGGLTNTQKSISKTDPGVKDVLDEPLDVDCGISRFVHSELLGPVHCKQPL